MVLKIFRYLLVILLTTTLFACDGGALTKRVNVELDGQKCYTAILPEDDNIESFMVLLPGFGESIDNVLESTQIPEQVAKEGIAVFIPILQDGIETYSFSSESQSNLRTVVKDIQTRFDCVGKDYIVGGFSMGGSAAIRYAELFNDNDLKCVFAIDSPLDYERFCYSTERDVEVYRKGIEDGDSIYVKLLEDVSPLIQDSPYLLSDTSHQAIKALRDMPIRYYIEPAEQWWLDNRRTDVLGLNILDATAFINDLRLIGNTDAELIVTHEKGYRDKGKTYHPHSWSIVDVNELIRWIKQCSDVN